MENARGKLAAFDLDHTKARWTWECFAHLGDRGPLETGRGGSQHGQTFPLDSLIQMHMARHGPTSRRFYAFSATGALAPVPQCPALVVLDHIGALGWGPIAGGSIWWAVRGAVTSSGAEALRARGPSSRPATCRRSSPRMAGIRCTGTITR